MVLFFLKKYLLKLLGNIKEKLSQNFEQYFINFIAIDDFFPKGGLPIA
jgi:hypothetical protein